MANMTNLRLRERVSFRTLPTTNTARVPNQGFAQTHLRNGTLKNLFIDSAAC